MKKIAFIVVLLPVTILMYAQNIAGEYYLQGVMETASGFQLNGDSTFQFFFSYGALDRYGEGKWSLQSDSIVILNSEKRPPLDFKLKKQTSVKENLFTIKIDDANKNILRYVQGYVKTKSSTIPFEMNDDGETNVKAQQADSIALIFTLCPDRYSVFPVTGSNNNFVFAFEPWIAKVFFENFILKYTNNTLQGKHPLLDGIEYNYEKE
ncbi:MAG: hypothetical protein JO072_05470 [Parafilimonas sp.]|nr:hypothetical protein [Parafilimonas sp.]